MLHKSFDILDAKADSESGTFEATVAVFGNVDKGGDRIASKAFDNTLAKWRDSGDPIPIILSHSWNDPFHHIGVADPHDVTPTEHGLHVKGKLDIADNDVARQVHKLMARRSLKEFSFGYSVPPGGQKRAKDGANDLTEIDLVEIGPTLKGMNPATELHAVKSAIEHENVPDAEALRKQAEQVAREEEQARIPKDVTPAEPAEKDLVAELLTKDPAELEAAAIRILNALDDGFGEKAVWTAAYINDLPDSAFLYVEPGGSKDSDGKTTPRSLRHFPYKDATGAVDLPHLRNALSRIPQSSLPQAVKDRLAAQAQRILDSMKSVDVTDQETKSRSVDPLRKQADEVAMEFVSGGLSLRKAPKHSEPQRPEPELEMVELKRRMREEILVHLSGGITQ